MPEAAVVRALGIGVHAAAVQEDLRLLSHRRTRSDKPSGIHNNGLH